jgi:hypothetical protein
MNTKSLSLLLTGFVIANPMRLVAQSYSIDWHKIAGGGGLSAQGPYCLNGTIGQHDAGMTLAGGSYSLTGGFWSIISLAPASAPVLTISHAGDSVVVSWPSSATGFTLQQNTSLATTNWVPTGYSIATADGTNSITITPPAGILFFRLANP